MKRFRSFLLCAICLGLLFLANRLWGEALARRLAAGYGERILQAAQGNVSDAGKFIQLRLDEGLLLVTLGVVAVFLHQLAAASLLSAGASKNRRWTVHAMLAFVLLNAWLAGAMRTGLFWCAMSQGKATQMLVRFHLKRQMLAEYPAPSKAVILGSSQARAQLDEGLLNTLLEPSLYTTEMHFPGSRAYGTRLIHRKLTVRNLDWVICYVSPLDFHAGQDSTTPASFFTLRDCHDLATPARKFVSADGFGYGILGGLLPVFKLRDVVSQRLLGVALTQVEQRRQDEKLLANLEASAGEVAAAFKVDDKSNFEYDAFESFVSDCETIGQRVLVLEGQLNPLVESRLDPEVRAHMLACLHRIRDAHPNVVLVEKLPMQAATDYEDLTHVNKETQARFTRFTAEVLRDLVRQSPPGERPADSKPARKIEGSLKPAAGS